jgi:DNA mismatch repair protein MutL
MIKILSQNVVNQIAAGEVVERPASVIKELIENSIDAGATEIKIYIEEFGTNKIQVVDNGSGIEKSDLERVFLKHATSKLSAIKDLDTIHSHGFRGEALASISSVSKVILNTKHKNDEVASELLYENGEIQYIKPSALTKGTDLQVLNLFQNIPARKKFLKSKSTENKVLLDTFHKFALVNPHITFYLNIDGISKTYPATSLKSRISSILKVNEENLIPLFYDGKIKISGFAIHPKVFLKNRSSQFIFVNGRTINDGTIQKASMDGFGTFMMKNQFPGYVILLEMPSSDVDVNVHPRKTEVRFSNPSEVYMSVKTAINKNITNFLREETLEKFQSRKENSQETITTANTVSESFETSENSFTMQTIVETAESTSSPSQEFESFLLSSTNNAVKVEENEERFVTQSALLFNEEIIKNGSPAVTNSLNFDIYNATQLLNSYILTSNEGSILVIDQHAASERYYYEKYLHELQSKSVHSKLLLFPLVVTLDSFEIKIIEENTELFESLGFKFEVFGSEEIKFSEVPDFIKMDNFGRVVEKIINDVLENQEISNVKDKLFHEIAAILACHTAVRFGDKLDRNEIHKILQNLMSCEDPYNCPHGRPVLQEWTKYDIEKKFKRCGL